MNKVLHVTLRGRMYQAMQEQEIDNKQRGEKATKEAINE